MEELSREELGLQFKDVPEHFCILINKREMEQPNNHKVFQLAIIDELNDDNDDIMVGLVNHEEGVIKPFMNNHWDENGVYKVNSSPSYPALYKKNKKDLIRII